MTWPAKHLTADDLDAFHSEALSGDVRLHLETCEACRRLIANDRFVLDQLAGLPAYQPAVGFIDRVMRRVAIGAPAKVPVLSFPRLTRRQVGAISALVAVMMLSVIWSAANRPVLESWLDGITATLWATATNAITLVSAQVAEHPWFEWVRQFFGSPVRLALIVTTILVAYGSGLIALRRMVTPTSGAVPNANV